MATKVTSLNVSPDLKAALVDVAQDLSAVNTPASSLVADVAAIRAQVVALVADMATRVAEHDTLVAKLNADAGVTDTNYATATPKTAVDPAVQTSSAPAAPSVTV